MLWDACDSNQHEKVVDIETTKAPILWIIDHNMPEDWENTKTLWQEPLSRLCASLNSIDTNRTPHKVLLINVKGGNKD